MESRLSRPVIRVLLAEDDDADAQALQSLLEDHDEFRFSCHRVRTLEEALHATAAGGYQVFLLDLSLPDGHGMTALMRAKEAAPSIPVIVMSDRDDQDLALDAVGLGAQEYAVKGRGGRSFVGMVLNAIERHRVLRDLRDARRQEYFLATHDALTGLLNRYAFLERLEEALPRARRAGTPLAVLFVDLDAFHQVNDRHGHAVGDELLRTLARRMSEASRSSDVLARLGGDEFVMMAQDPSSRDGLEVVARRLIESLAEPIVVGDVEHRVQSTLGIARFPDDGDDADTLLRHAELAMGEAKGSGGDRHAFYAHGMRPQLALGMRSGALLRRALDRNELTLNYQPQVDLTTGEIVGAEALLRWEAPDGPGGSPARLVEEAERLGMIGAIGEWVLRQAVKEIVEISAAGHGPLPIAVNVSGQQLADARFPDLVNSVLRDQAFDPALLELEITESVAIHEKERGIENLRRLRRAGVRAALDDFGTGFATIQALRRLPLDALKIDRTFVAGLPSSSLDRAVVEGMLTMARGLGCNVVAEGVETREQLHAVRDLGCHRAQGFLLAEPMTADKLVHCLAGESDGAWAELLEVER